MANEAKIDWITPVAISSTTGLNSLASGSVWNSGEITHADPAALIVRIWYEVDFATPPVAGDSLIFRIAYTDGQSTPEIWDGNVGTTTGTTATAATIADYDQGCARVHTHAWITAHTVQFSGHFDIEMPSEGWQLLVEPDGEALAASGHTIRYQYGHPQYQTA